MDLRANRENMDPPQNDNNDGNNNQAKACRCVLCGNDFFAASQEDCVAHMEECQAFARVHPESGGTNPDGVYPGGKNPASATASTTTPIPNNNNADPATTVDVSELQKAIEEMSIKELRQVIVRGGLEYKDCIEKQELQQRAREAREKIQ